MNKQTHTPGPWHVEHPFQEEGVYISNKSTALVAKLYEPDRYAWHGDRVESIEANARLIAAAPDMLDALRCIADVASKAKEIMECLILPESCPQDIADMEEIEKRARAAIAKATGTEA